MRTSQIALFASNALFSGASAYKLLRGHHGVSETGAAQTRIIGGDDANTGEYPYAVSLSFPSWVSTSPHFCGGSMIGPDVVLTAA